MTIDTDPTPAHGTTRPLNKSTHRHHKITLTLDTDDSDNVYAFINDLHAIIEHHHDLTTHPSTEITFNEYLNEHVTHIDTSLF